MRQEAEETTEKWFSENAKKLSDNIEKLQQGIDEIEKELHKILVDMDKVQQETGRKCSEILEEQLLLSTPHDNVRFEQTDCREVANGVGFQRGGDTLTFWLTFEPGEDG
jgi:uncharacterized coiled-coil DUF342 family protein